MPVTVTAAFHAVRKQCALKSFHFLEIRRKAIILPRQARDKHREDSNKERRFMQDEIDGEDAYTPGRTISGDGSELPTAAAAAEGEGGEVGGDGEGGGSRGGGGGGGGLRRRYADHFYWPHFAILAQLPATVQKTPLFAPFIYTNEHFAKTGSGQT
jgi:hypothetical protein